MTIKIMGEKWKISTLVERNFHKRFGKCLAITIPTERKIIIKRDEVNYPVIIHELVHAYFSYMSIMNVTMDHKQADEFYCDFFGDYGPQILAHAKIIKETLDLKKTKR